MSAFKKIIKKYRNYFFKKKTGNIIRQKRVVNYHDAKNIGLIYDASHEENYMAITEITRRLQFDNKTVYSLGFFRQKKKPEYCFPKLIFGFFSSRDFTWSFEVKSNFAHEFIQTEFDILIDLSPSGIFHTKYVAALSKAKYKVGIYSKEYFFIYDLLLDVNENIPLEKVIDHSLHYLKTINNQKAYAK